MNEKTILIWGAGAIGGTLGAYLARAGEDVLLVDIVEPHTRDAVRALRPHLAENGSVLSAQNGLNELVIAEEIGVERTVGCFVNFGADWLEPGRILFGNRATVAVGEIDGHITERAKEYHRLLSIFEPQAVLTDNIWGYLWGKLGYGTMLFATALTNGTMSENLASQPHFPVFHRLGREVMAVATARRIRPLGFNGFDPDAFMPGADEADARRSDVWIATHAEIAAFVKQECAR